MLSPQNQLTSYKLSRRLKELEVPQKSLFAWFHIKHIDEWELCQSGSTADVSDWTSENHISAFTSAELGEILPDGNEDENRSAIFTFRGDPEAYTVQKYGRWVCYVNHTDGTELACLHADTEADARAKMLIHLLEQGLLTLTPKE